MRTKSVLINAITGVCGKCSNIIFQFISRTLFITILGATYLGVHGLFSQVLSVLALAELGIGNAIVFKLYKAIANEEHSRIRALMDFYGRAYRKIGFIILVAGVCCTPLVPYIAKSEEVIPDLKLIYLLFVISSATSYFFIYKSAFLVANQKEYIYTIIRIVFNFIQIVVQLVVLYITKSFIYYLIAQISIDVLKNIFVSWVCNRMYPFLKERKKEQLERLEIRQIFRDVKALVICKVSEVMMNSTDNIIISSIVGIVESGIFSNYATIIMHINQMINTIIYALNASIGNYNAVETQENKYKMLCNMNFMINWIYGAASICLFTLISPLIRLWLNEFWVFPTAIVLIICLNFYFGGTQNIIWTFRQTMGLFVHGKYKPLISVGVNLVASIFLTRYFGIIGVLIGTLITHIGVDAWFDAWIVYKHGFNRSVKVYYLWYIKTTIGWIVAGGVTYFTASLFSGHGAVTFLGKMFCAIMIPNLLFFIANRNTDEMQFLRTKLVGILSKLRGRSRGVKEANIR